MRIACTADWHIRSDTPKSRCDEDYVGTQFSKVKQILAYCVANGIKVLLVAGDVFDKARVPRWLSNRYMELFIEYSNHVVVVACAGQHDQIHHTLNLENTSLGTLIAAQVIVRDLNSIQVCDWGDEIDHTKSDAEDGILVLHATVVEKPGSVITGAITADEILGRYNHRFIITGDNHKPFVVKRDGRTLVNCGSLMRQSRDQIDYKPAIWVIDTHNPELDPERVELEVKPADEVFDLVAIKHDKSIEHVVDKFKSFIDAVNDVGKFDGKFEINVTTVIQQLKPSQSVTNIISEVMDHAEGDS